MYRSAEMGYYSIVIPYENVWEILNHLGTCGSIELVDMNKEIG